MAKQAAVMVAYAKAAVGNNLNVVYPFV
jgi:hypothetical protein